MRLEFDEGDTLVGVDITDGIHDIMLVSNAGKAVRFAESDVRTMGRTARGVRGIKLQTESTYDFTYRVEDGRRHLNRNTAWLW